MRKIFWYGVFMTVFLPAGAQQRQTLVHKLSQILQEEVDSNRIPGAVLQVKYNGKVIYSQAAGYASLYDTSGKRLAVPESMTTGHLFDIASLTKVTGTTTAIMLLTDMGKLHPDDPVGKYIPAFNSPDKKTITIRHLLTHTSGLYDWYPLYYRASDAKATYELIGSLPLKYPAGAGRHYSDLGFIILGQIIETVSGESLEEFETRHIFQPLGMKHTLYNPERKQYPGPVASTSHGNPFEYRMVHDSSMGYVFKEINPDQWNGWRHYTLHGEVNDGNSWYACKGVNGAAGLFSTIEDLQKLVDMLMNNGLVGGRSFIRPETIRLFLSKDAFNNGLGWMMDPDNSFMKNAPAGSFGHTGFTGTSIAVVPSRKLSVILLINRQNTGLLPSKEYYNPNAFRRKVFETVMQFINSK